MTLVVRMTCVVFHWVNRLDDTLSMQRKDCQSVNLRDLCTQMEAAGLLSKRTRADEMCL